MLYVDSRGASARPGSAQEKGSFFAGSGNNNDDIDAVSDPYSKGKEQAAAIKNQGNNAILNVFK